MLSGKYWPFHPKPLPDEILSSWIVRTALGNGLLPSTFCQLEFNDPRLLALDIDRTERAHVITRMAEKTGTAQDSAEQTVLRSLQGELVEGWVAHGRMRWLLYAGARHRLRRLAGPQFCPRCLAEDDHPYFRRSWRLALYAACPHHSVILLDRCPDCQAPLMPYRAEQLHLCGSCDSDLRTSAAQPADFPALVLHRRNSLALERGWTTLCETDFLRSHLYFDLLYQILRILYTGKRCGRLRTVIADQWGGDDPAISFPRRELEAFSPSQRHRLLALAARLLEGWPYRFVGACAEAGVWEAYALFDVKDTPYALAEPIRRYLCRAVYAPAEGEVLAAMAFLRRQGIDPSQHRLKPYVGDTQIASRLLAVEANTRSDGPVRRGSRASDGSASSLASSDALQGGSHRRRTPT